MQFEHLSDHAGDELRRAETRHGEAQRYAQHSVEQVNRADVDYREAQRTRSLWKRVLGVSSSETREAQQRLVGAQLQSSQAQQSVWDWGHEVDRQRAGVDGERSLAAWLGVSLSDEWVGFGGYKNKRGEADLVLVGPPGVWVVEVKNRNAQLFADGDEWRYQKFDNYGNVVDGGPATDGGDRTWGQQASHVAESLSWWLGHNELAVPVRTAVVNVHPKASVALSASPGVDLVTADPHQLLSAVASAPPTVAQHVREQVARLIRRDHAYHDRKMRDR